MSEKINQFCENLRVKLNGVETQLQKVGENLTAAPQKAADSIRATIDAATEQHEKNMETLSATKAQLDQRFNDKKKAVAAQIDEWKTNREIHKLEHRADNAESYALAAIDFAAVATAEADLATLEAIVARMDAEEATQTA